MPGESTLVLQTRKTFVPYTPLGRKVIWETTNTDSGSPMAGGFQGVTGSIQGSSIIPDVTYNQTASVLMEGAAGCPSSCLPYLERISAAVNGNTAWATSSTGLAGIAIEDTNSDPLLYIPMSALVVNGKVAKPAPQVYVGPQATVASSGYNTSTGVMTFAANSFPSASNALANIPGVIIAGTGQGQTFYVSASSATSLTPVGGAAAFPTALDNTSVVQLAYWPAAGGSIGTPTAPTVTSTNCSSIPTNLGYVVLVVAGPGAGQYGTIVSNSAGTITLATTSPWTTATTSASVFIVTNSVANLGAVDLSIAYQWPSAQLNTGLQATVKGTMTGGSPARIMWQGYYAYQ